MPPGRASPLRWCLVSELSWTHVTPAIFTPGSSLWDVAHLTVTPSAHSCQVFAEAPMLSACCSAPLFKALAPYAAFWGHSCDPHPPSISPVAPSLPPNVPGRTPPHPPCGLKVLFQCHTCWTLEIPPRHLGWSLPLCFVTLEPDMCLSGSDPLCLEYVCLWQFQGVRLVSYVIGTFLVSHGIVISLRTGVMPYPSDTLWYSWHE